MDKEIPLYLCHKTVRAFKIKAIEQASTDHPAMHQGGDWILVGEDHRVTVGHKDYYLKFTPGIGGYFVKYEDGYQSYSPAGAFEQGYTLIEPPPAYRQRVIAEKKELDEKLAKLIDFLQSKASNRLPPGARPMLVHQRDVMRAYSDILADRILNF